MFANRTLRRLVCATLALALVAGGGLLEVFGAGRGGGGGARGGGGGGFSRPSSSAGRGTIRYGGGSAPTARPSPPISRPSAPVSRPSTLPSAPVSGFTRPSAPAISQQPANYGSIRHSGTPGASTFPARPGGSWDVVQGPGGGKGLVGTGSGGTTGGIYRGPGGGTAGAITGPGGGAAGAIRGPGGYGAAAIRGPGGYGAAAAWGPYGGGAIARLPEGSRTYRWHNNDYYWHGYGWYRPYWYGDNVYYFGVYPPVGFYYGELPQESTTVVINNITYYYGDGVYYQQGEEGGKKGYVVAEAPKQEKKVEGDPNAPDPFALLKKSCDYLAGQRQFNVFLSVTAEQVLESGSKIQKTGKRTISVNRPNKVAVDYTDETMSRHFAYDGASLTMQDRQRNVYALAPMPNTIDGMLDTLSRVYGVAPPLDDLLYANPYDGLVAQVETGQSLGRHSVLEAECDHLVFTQAALDWEIWIEAGDRPLPRKMVIRYKQLQGVPIFAATVTRWNLSPVFPPDIFDTKPPEGAQKIEVLPVAERQEAPPATAPPGA